MDNPKELYKQLVKQGLHPKDAAKQAQERTGLSVVTGAPINRQLGGKFSHKTGKIIGQYGS